MQPEIEKLPNLTLKGQNKLNKRFIEFGCVDFHSACNWLWKLPYQTNETSDVNSVFVEGCGTCTTKHGVAATLAEELGLQIHKYLVFYRLDDSIIRGAGDVMERCNVPFIPGRHCVLGFEGFFTDLTWGNQTGKLIDLVDFELYVRVPPFPSHQESEDLYAWALSWYQKDEPKLKNLSIEDAISIRKECFQLQIKCAC